MIAEMWVVVEQEQASQVEHSRVRVYSLFQGIYKLCILILVSFSTKLIGGKNIKNVPNLTDSSFKHHHQQLGK